MNARQKIALVTGAGSGIGRSVSLALFSEGYSLVLAGRREEPLAETARVAGDDGARTLVVPTDVSLPDSVDRLFERIAGRFGRLDLLFNNAGIFIRETPLEDLAFDDWQRAVDVNLTGAFLCLQAAFRMMKKQDPPGGRIINNGSVSAQVPRPQAVAYTATKHGITGLTRAAWLDGRSFGIACGQIDIGNASTDMTDKMSRGVLQADGSTAPEPVMDVRDVARAVVYMASLPLDANVPFLTVMANGMPLAGRG